MRAKYAEVSVSAEGKFQYPTGRAGAEALGYAPYLLDEVEADFLNSFCGVGNPFSIAAPLPGSIMLDIGCGAGFDVFVASRLTGQTGRVYGIDLTDEMVALARKNLERMGVTNVEIVHVDSEEIPFEDGAFDVVISNGVINLAPRKLFLFEQIHRVLKPGGRLQFADVMAEKDLPSAMATSFDAWAQ